MGKKKLVLSKYGFKDLYDSNNMVFGGNLVDNLKSHSTFLQILKPRHAKMIWFHY